MSQWTPPLVPFLNVLISRLYSDFKTQSLNCSLVTFDVVRQFDIFAAMHEKWQWNNSINMSKGNDVK